MPLYLCKKYVFLDILYLVGKSAISCVLCASVKVTGLSWSEKIPFEYWNNRILLISLKTRFCSWFFQVAKKLINQFLLFQYSCLYISAKKYVFLDILYLVRKSVISCVLCASVKVTGLSWAEKIPSEYWNNRILLMSLKTRFCSWFFQVAKKLINQFLLFQYSCLYISAKNRYASTFYTSLERAWLAVYCVQVWKLQVFHGPRQSPLNIETIEFC